jgi:hypothetical protein
MHLHALLFSASFKSENTKTYLLSCIHLQNPKIPYTNHITLLHHYLLYLHLHLVLDNHSVELGARKFFYKLLEEERQELSRLFLESSILNPEFPCGENLLLQTTLCTWSPHELAPLLSVISCWILSTAASKQAMLTGAVQTGTTSGAAVGSAYAMGSSTSENSRKH